MLTLQNLLEYQSHRGLEQIARAHHLPFSRRVSKQVGLKHLSDGLHQGVLHQSIAKLTSKEIDALQALVAHGGVLDLAHFVKHFGDIRRYRSWHPTYGKTPDNPRHPWRYPGSITEKLYQLGFIHLHDNQQVELVTEVAEALPPLPEHIFWSRYVDDVPVNVSQIRQSLLIDLSTMLGLITKTEAHAIQGCWLSIPILRQINEALSIPEDLANCRSELQTGRLRWLHYLLQVSDLICIDQGQFIMTPLAWDWLKLAPSHQWDVLWQAVEHDLTQSDRLWDVFRFPEIDHFSALVIRHLVMDCHVNKSYRIKDILTMTRPYLLDSHVYDMAWFIRDILGWSGVVSYTQGHVQIQSKQFDESQDSQLLPMTWLNRSLPIQLSSEPHLIPYTRLLSFARIQRHPVGSTQADIRIALIDKRSIQTAYRQGYKAEDIIDILVDLTDAVIPESIIKQIQTWFKEAQQLIIAPMVVLEADNPDQLDEIDGDWRLRPYIQKRLSPHEIAIRKDQVEPFLQRLHRRNHNVTSLLSQNRSEAITEQLNPHMIDYLLLAVRTYQSLYDRMDTSAYIPSALTEWLRNRSNRPDEIEATVEDLILTLRQALPATIDTPDTQQDLVHIERILRLAHHDQVPVTITYHSPWSDETTTRDILIELIFEERGKTYIDSYCYRDNDKRQFRLDRVLRATIQTKDRRQIG